MMVRNNGAATALLEAIGKREDSGYRRVAARVAGPVMAQFVAKRIRTRCARANHYGKAQVRLWPVNVFQRPTHPTSTVSFLYPQAYQVDSVGIAICMNLVQVSRHPSEADESDRYSSRRIPHQILRRRIPA